MTKAEIASAVNEWFNIENYSVLKDLTVEQLFKRLKTGLSLTAWGKTVGVAS